MTYQLLFISILIFIGSCNSSSNIYSKFPDRATVSASEEGVQITEKTLHIRSLELAESENEHILIIKGDFPNACTQILKADENAENKTIHLQITGWQVLDEMCAQVLTPFTFLHEISDDIDLSEFELISANNAQLHIIQ